MKERAREREREKGKFIDGNRICMITTAASDDVDVITKSMITEVIILLKINRVDDCIDFWVCKKFKLYYHEMRM